MKHYSPSQLMKNAILILSIALFGCTMVKAQVSSLVNPTYGYTFLNTTSTYTSLGAGGTVFQTGTAINTDGVSASIALPFTFTFNGIKENNIFISNNGFITFATAPATTNYTPLSTTTTSGYDGAIAGTGMNCVASTASGASPEIRYGSNGGGDFVVQYQDIGQSSYAAIRMTYQIILKADGKTVQIVYGPNNVGVASSNQCQVGLRGTNDEDWNNRTLSSGGNWNTAGGAAGTANSSAMTLTASSTLPTSGRTFQWSPTSYTPTYLTNPGGVVQDFTTWVNGAGPANIPSINWASNGYGNASWQIDNTTVSTTGSGWTGTASNGIYSPVDYVNAGGGHSARFHSYQSNSPQVGYLDYYVDLSTITGTPTIDFYHINTSGTDILQVFLSTNGGGSFNQIGSNIGVSATWTAKSISLGATNSATTIIRFKATSDWGLTDIGLDRVVITPPPALPTISGFTPTPNLCANGGQTVTITGTNFTGTSSVKFNAVNAVSFSVVNSTTITAVTPSGLTAGTIDVTNPAGTASSSAYTVVSNPTVAVTPTSNSLCVPGATAVELEASGATTYAWGPAGGLNVTTGANVNALPTSTTTYTVIGTDGNGCTGTATSAFTVTPGVTATASASPLNVCNGANSQLDVVAVQGGGLSVIGAGASTSSSTAASFFPGFWGGAKTQYIVLGSELIAQGLKAGNITALAYEPTTAGQTYQGFFISLGTTAQSSMTTSFITTGLTEVYAGTLADNGILPVANTVNTLTFGTGGTASAFNWDGSSNIVVSISWSSVPNASTATSSTMKVDAPGFTCSAYDQQDNVSPATMKASTTADGTGTNRPRFTFTGNKLVVSPTYAWTESPATTLTSTSIANPMSNGITATNNYTVTVTGAGGCTATSTLTVNVAGSVVCSAIASSNGATLCAGQNTTLTASATIGGTPYTYDWTADASLSATNIANPVATPTATTTYTCTVTDACGTTCSTTITINVNALPTVGVSPTSGTICNPGGTSVSLTASGTATGYTWLPATGLSATSGASVNALPSSSTTYTVTGTDANGCTGTSSAVISVNLIPVLTSVTATPATICSGDNSNLSAVHQTVTTAAGMIYSASTGASFETITSPTVVTSATGGADDGYMTVTPAGFTFPFLNTSNTSFGVGTNGYIVLGSNSSSIPSSITSITSLNLIYAFGRDGNLNVSNGGSLTHGFDATNTKYIFEMVKYSGGGSGAESSTIYASYQIVLWGSTSTEPGKIEVIYGTNLGTPASSGTIGIRDVAGTYINGINGLTNSTATQSTWPVSGQKYSYSLPGSPTFSWSPATFLSSTTVSNPTATAVTSTTPYTVTATANGCSTTGTVTVTVSTGASITTDPANTSACTNSNASFTVVATGPGLTYQWFVDDGTGFAPISPGAPYSGETSATLTISNPSASLDNYQYQVEVSSTCGSAVTSQPATLTVNTPASVTTNPTSGLICNPGGTAVSVTASGANTYTWAPTSGLTPSTGATVSANPSSTTTYTVTGVDGNGCSASATVAITLAQSITSLNTTGSSTSVCEGAPITLASAGVLAGYQMNVAGTEVFYDINTTGTTVGTQGDDSEHNISMPSFVFNGVAYTTARVGNNGAIALGSTTGSIEWGNVALPSTANGAGNVLLLPFWDDLDVTLVDDIQTEIVGSKFIIQYTNKDHNSFNTGGITFQVQLDNATGEIHFIYDDVTFGDVAYDAGASATIGIQYSSTSALQYSFNTASLTTGQCITFTPNTLAYNWTGPNSYSAATQNASVNPSVSASAGTYTVTATSGAGCTLTSTIAVSLTNSADIALATSSNALSSVGTDNSTRNHLNGLSLMYSNATCLPIASISDAAGGNELGSTQAAVEVLSTVPSSTTTSYYYSSRYYNITPNSNGPATLTLYFTQDDFSDYNTGNSYQVDMPTTGSNSDPNIGNIKVARVIGDLSTGTITNFTSPTVNWDATNSRWEVTISPSEVGGKYYLYTPFSCALNISYPTLQANGIGAQSATISWGAVAGAQDYRIRWRQQGTTTWSVNTNATTSKSFTTLVPNTTYEVQVRVRCSNTEQGEYSNTMTFTTLPNPCLPPTGLASSNVTTTSADVSWNTVGSGTSYFVQLRVVGNAWGGGSTVLTTSKSFTGLVPGTNYEARVYTNCSGTPSSAYTASVFFTTTALSCTAPTGLAVGSITNTSAVATWNSVAAGSSYFVQLRKVGDSWAGGSTVSTLSKSYTGLIPGTNYEARVSTNCGGVVSAVSGSVFFSTTGTLCVAPTGLNTTGLTPTGVTLNWTSTGATSYSTRVRVAGTSWGGNSGSTTNSKVITGLTPNTNYEYQIIGICGSIASPWSAIGTFTTGASMMPILFEEETAKAGFMVYPNPTRDQITIEFSTETLQATKVKVLDMTGRVVKTVEAVPQAGEHQYTLSLSELSAGMYTVQVYTDDKLSYVSKVQKQD
jgi:hypothetical protein